MKAQDKIEYNKFERERLDSFLASIYKDYSRSYFQNLIAKSKQNAHFILVNDKPSMSSYQLKRSDIIKIEFPKEKAATLKPEKMDLDIIYEDADIIVINKSPNIVVHPSYGHPGGTLLNALIW
ncbi:MAG: RNA pseudouridine synthase, partial [Elusimicrobiota bacterium]|nr:RNA pseudouridine synthase [Elusimicrobiota bacterium]